MFQWVKDMANLGPRRAGSEPGHRCENYLLEKLIEFGLKNVHKEQINVEYWEAQKSSVEIFDGTEFKMLPSQWIPYAAFTEENGIEAELVYADPSKFIQGGNWKGKIVVTDICFPKLDVTLLRKFSLGVFDPDNDINEINHPATWVRINWHFYRQAFQKGAVGFIGILKDQPGGSYRMYAPYGFKEKNILDKPLPGFWVSRNDGPFLRESAKKGMKARLKLTGIRHSELTHNLAGEIPGKNDEIVIIHCHHDSPFMSPVEDASGCSVILALARYFAEKQDVARTILVLFTAGHFYGSIGTRTFINQHKEDIVPRVVLEISVEHIAKEAIENQDGDLVESGRPEGTGIFVPFNSDMVSTVLRSVGNHHLNRVFLLPPEGPLGDYPPTDGGDWYEAGVPIINIISNPVYLLNAEDDFQWVMKERLPKVASVLVDIIREVDGMDKERIGKVEFKGFKLKMKLIKRLSRAKTTKLGIRPVY
jgi:hypothetical protein